VAVKNVSEVVSDVAEKKHRLVVELECLVIIEKIMMRRREGGSGGVDKKCKKSNFQ